MKKAPNPRADLVELRHIGDPKKPAWDRHEDRFKYKKPDGTGPDKWPEDDQMILKWILGGNEYELRPGEFFSTTRGAAEHAIKHNIIAVEERKKNHLTGNWDLHREERYPPAKVIEISKDTGGDRDMGRKGTIGEKLVEVDATPKPPPISVTPLPPEKPFEELSIGECRTACKDRGITLTNTDKRADMIEKLEEFEARKTEEEKHV